MCVLSHVARASQPFLGSGNLVGAHMWRALAGLLAAGVCAGGWSNGLSLSGLSGPTYPEPIDEPVPEEAPAPGYYAYLKEKLIGGTDVGESAAGRSGNAD
eukprot:3277787-Amphidinium_carterae.3